MLRPVKTIALAALLILGWLPALAAQEKKASIPAGADAGKLDALFSEMKFIDPAAWEAQRKKLMAERKVHRDRAKELVKRAEELLRQARDEEVMAEEIGDRIILQRDLIRFLDTLQKGKPLHGDRGQTEDEVNGTGEGHGQGRTKTPAEAEAEAETKGQTPADETSAGHDERDCQGRAGIRSPAPQLQGSRRPRLRVLVHDLPRAGRCRRRPRSHHLGFRHARRRFG